MTDIYLALLLMGALSAAAFAIALKFARKTSPLGIGILATFCLAGILLNAYICRDSLLLARAIPLTGLIVMGNWLPVFAAGLGALAWACVRETTLYRVALVGPLLAGGFWLAYGPLTQPTPTCHNVWSDGVCRQTTDASCSAACAATLLSGHSISATEGEMARLCLTTTSGTSRHGLFRGLKLKTAGTPWQVEVLRSTRDQLQASLDGPVILFVGLGRMQKADPRYEHDWGWRRGLAHAVVLFAFTDDRRIEIGDPSIGHELWAVEALDVLWRGEGLRLTPRLTHNNARQATDYRALHASAALGKNYSSSVPGRSPKGRAAGCPH